MLTDPLSQQKIQSRDKRNLYYFKIEMIQKDKDFHDFFFSRINATSNCSSQHLNGEHYALRHPFGGF